jgi:proline dehydrogenase
MSKIFNNTQNAFSSKTNKQLNRAYFLFKMLSYPTLVKIGTAFTNLALKLKLPVESIIRVTVFDHFCGGISEKDCVSVVNEMYSYGVSSVLDYSVEGKEDESHFDTALQTILGILDFAKSNPAIPFIVFKPTGFGRIDLYEKVGNNLPLSNDENTEWNRVKARFEKVCQRASDYDVLILIDGEESWMQDAADDLVLALMKKFNKNKALIFNTLQMYRWDRLAYLKQIHEISKTENFHIGMKLVRGAYMEKENKRAEENGYKSPICISKKASDENFDLSVEYMLQNISSMALFAGTHNEESSYKLMDLMAKSNIQNNDKRIWFGQLYGMSDNISFNLAKNGFNVAKYLPFGPVKEVMPYLIRRAQENTSVAGQTSRELTLIKTERTRRKLA